MSESLLYGTEVDHALVKRSDSILEDVRIYLINLMSQEQVFKIKVDCIQKNLGYGNVSAINVTRTQTEVEKLPTPA